MKRDLFLVAVGMIAVGLVAWSLTGNPPRTTRFHAERHLTEDIRIKFITERSP